MRNPIAVSALVLFSGLITGVTAAQTSAPHITITPTPAQKVITGAPDRFIGSVRVQSLFDPTEPSRTSGGVVTFQQGARSAWHTHPLGQILIVTDALAGYSNGVIRFRSFAREMSFGFPPESSTGTERRRQPR
jgi:hypothetical protein